VLAALGWLARGKEHTPAAPSPTPLAQLGAPVAAPPTKAPTQPPVTPPASPQPSHTALPAELQIAVEDGQVSYQSGNRVAGSATAGSPLQVGQAPRQRLSTPHRPARLSLGHGVHLVLDQATSISLLSDDSASQLPLIRLESGRLLVAAGNLTIQSNDSRYRAVSTDAAMGVSFDRDRQQFAVDCLGLAGSCLLVDDQGAIVLYPGQSQARTGQGLGQLHRADFAAWTILGGPQATAPAETAAPTARAQATTTKTKAGDDGVRDSSTGKENKNDNNSGGDGGYP